MIYSDNLDLLSIKISNMVDLAFYQKKVGCNSMNYLIKNSEKKLKMSGSVKDSDRTYYTMRSDFTTEKKKSFFRIIFMLEIIYKMSIKNIFLGKEDFFTVFNNCIEEDKKKGFVFDFIIDKKRNFLFLNNEKLEIEKLLTSTLGIHLKNYYNNKIDLERFFVIKESEKVDGILYEKIKDTSFFKEKKDRVDAFFRDNSYFIYGRDIKLLADDFFDERYCDIENSELKLLPYDEGRDNISNYLFYVRDLSAQREKNFDNERIQKTEFKLKLFEETYSFYMSKEGFEIFLDNIDEILEIREQIFKTKIEFHEATEKNNLFKNIIAKLKPHVYSKDNRDVNEEDYPITLIDDYFLIKDGFKMGNKLFSHAEKAYDLVDNLIYYVKTRRLNSALNKKVSRKERFEDILIESSYLDRELNYLGSPYHFSEKEYDEKIKKIIINTIRSEYYTGNDELITTCFEQLKEPFYIVFAKENTFLKKGLLNVYKVKEVSELLELAAEQKSFDIVTNKFYEAQLHWAIGGYYPNWSSKNKKRDYIRLIKKLSIEQKHFVLNDIFNGNKDYVILEISDKALSLINERFSQEDLELLELNYEETGNAIYEKIIAKNKEYKDTSITTDDFKSFVQELKDMSIIRDIDEKTLLIDSLEYILPS